MSILVRFYFNSILQSIPNDLPWVKERFVIIKIRKNGVFIGLRKERQREDQKKKLEQFLFV